MNANSASVPPLSEAELIVLGCRAFEGLGLPSFDARQVTRILVLADLFGLSTHGLSRIESYGERLNVGGIAAAPRVAVQKVAPALVKVDGGTVSAHSWGCTPWKRRLMRRGNTASALRSPGTVTTLDRFRLTR
jgi:hypothetical protein